jgi:hypothetical protein
LTATTPTLASINGLFYSVEERVGSFSSNVKVPKDSESEKFQKDAETVHQIVFEFPRRPPPPGLLYNSSGISGKHISLQSGRKRTSLKSTAPNRDVRISETDLHVLMFVSDGPQKIYLITGIKY